MIAGYGGTVTASDFTGEKNIKEHIALALRCSMILKIVNETVPFDTYVKALMVLTRILSDEQKGEEYIVSVSGAGALFFHVGNKITLMERSEAEMILITLADGKDNAQAIIDDAQKKIFALIDGNIAEAKKEQN